MRNYSIMPIYIDLMKFPKYAFEIKKIFYFHFFKVGYITFNKYVK